MADGLLVFAVSRFFVGIAVGVSSMLAPLYIAELAPLRIRGALVTLSQMAISAGVVAAYYVDYLLAGSGNWRWMFMSALLPSFMLLAGVFYLPETPRWLAARSRFEEAREILSRIEKPAEVERNLGELRQVTGAAKLNFRDLFHNRFRKPLLVGVILAVFQQITGVNTIVYYAPTIFQMVGFRSASVAILATFVIGTVGLSLTIVAMFLLDKVGRRPLLLISLTGMCLTLMHLAYILRDPSPAKWVVVADIVVYLAAFDIGLGPVFWLLISEIYPTTIRGEAMSVATVANWGSNFLVTATFLTLVERLGMRGCFLLFAALCLIGLLFSYLMVPETRGRTLEEIEMSWR
jgi:MFS transporter, SP family, galactose:H+ symporter